MAFIVRVDYVDSSGDFGIAEGAVRTAIVVLVLSVMGWAQHTEVTIEDNQTITGNKTFSGTTSYSTAGTFTNTSGNDGFTGLIHGCVPSTQFFLGGGNYATAGITGCVIQPVGSTAHNADPIQGFVQTFADSRNGGSTPGVSANASAGFFEATISANNAAGWGLNPVVNCGDNSLTAYTNILCIGNEVDVNWDLGLGGTATSSTGIGVFGAQFAGQKGAGDQTPIGMPAGAAAFTLSPNNYAWYKGINFNSGSVQLSGTYGVGPAVYLGALNAAHDNPSQGIVMEARNAANSATYSTVNADEFGNILLTPGGAVTQLKGTRAFSTLPACSNGGPAGASMEGALAPVSDSNTVTWGATIAGSSTNHVLAYCDGTNWTVAGK